MLRQFDNANKVSLPSNNNVTRVGKMLIYENYKNKLHLYALQ